MAKLQPKDPSVLTESAFQIEVILGAKGRPQFRLLTPESVIGGRLQTKADLELYLERMQHNLITLHEEDVTSRRWHMERVRPAVRYYCRKYGVPVPAWLQGNHGYDRLSPQTHRELFGDRPLHVQEFRTWGEILQAQR